MLQAFILIAVSSGSERFIYDQLKQLPEVEEINEIFGEYDLIIRISVKDTRELDTLESDKLRAIKDIKLTSTMIVAR